MWFLLMCMHNWHVDKDRQQTLAGMLLQLCRMMQIQCTVYVVYRPLISTLFSTAIPMVLYLMQSLFCCPQGHWELQTLWMSLCAIWPCSTASVTMAQFRIWHKGLVVTKQGNTRLDSDSILAFLWIMFLRLGSKKVAKIAPMQRSARTYVASYCEPALRH